MMRFVLVKEGERELLPNHGQSVELGAFGPESVYFYGPQTRTVTDSNPSLPRRDGIAYLLPEDFVDGRLDLGFHNETGQRMHVRRARIGELQLLQVRDFFRERRG